MNATGSHYQIKRKGKKKMMTDRLFCELVEAQQSRRAKQWAEERAAYERMQALQLQGTYKFEIRKGDVTCQIA